MLSNISCNFNNVRFYYSVLWILVWVIYLCMTSCGDWCMLYKSRGNIVVYTDRTEDSLYSRLRRLIKSQLRSSLLFLFLSCLWRLLTNWQDQFSPADTYRTIQAETRKRLAGWKKKLDFGLWRCGCGFRMRWTLLLAEMWLAFVIRVGIIGSPRAVSRRPVGHQRGHGPASRLGLWRLWDTSLQWLRTTLLSICRTPVSHLTSWRQWNGTKLIEVCWLWLTTLRFFQLNSPLNFLLYVRPKAGG